jgi:hypothetical protein
MAVLISQKFGYSEKFFVRTFRKLASAFLGSGDHTEDGYVAYGNLTSKINSELSLSV